MTSVTIPSSLQNLVFHAEPSDEAIFWRNWNWMVPSRYRVEAYTAFGDWFLIDVEKSRWIALDMLEGTARQLPNTFQQLLHDAASSAEMRDDWFLEGLVEGMRRRGVFLSAHEAYEFKVHPSLGAPIDCSNIAVERLDLSQAKLSSLFRR